MKRSLSRTRAAVAAACLLAPCAAAAQTEPADLQLAEVFYDAVGGDDQLEWVELVNAGDVAVDLAGYSLGWGGSDWTSGRQALEGVVDAGARFVVGGPLSAAADASPVFDLAVDLEPDLQNSGATADGVALFAVTADAIAADTLPVDVVVYGEANTSGLIDPSGAVAAVDVADAPGGSSIERGADGAWRVQAAPTPGAPPAPVPEPSRELLALGAALGAAARRGARATDGAGASR